MNIVKPTLVLNKERVIKNIETMAKKISESGVRFRPHFKTHQSAQIGEWFKDYGVNSITVSSVDMAVYFAENGWEDITIAFPVNVREIGRINKLAQKVSLHLLVESKETISFLEQNLKSNVNIWIKNDVGSKRTGILWDNFNETVKLAKEIEKNDILSFKGILTHAGHSYLAKSHNELRKIHYDIVFRMQEVKQKLQSEGVSDAEISIGNTPTCSIIDDFSDVDEIRPGNFVFYDVMQLNIGSCVEENIAAALACPVVAKHADRNEIVIHGGAVHLSNDFFMNIDGVKIFGLIAFPEENGWSSTIKDTYVSSLSQEHGIVKFLGEISQSLCDRIQIGDLLMVLPIHSCLTANLMREYLTLEGNIIQTMSKCC